MKGVSRSSWLDRNIFFASMTSQIDLATLSAPAATPTPPPATSTPSPPAPTSSTSPGTTTPAASSQSTSPNGTSPFLYDGRGFLRQAGDAGTAGTVTPTYDSSGLLHSLVRQPAGGPTRRYTLFYLAGRPVAQLATESGQTDRWWYLTTDHLGTPTVATGAAQATLWKNNFEPFGNDPSAGTVQGSTRQRDVPALPGAVGG